MQDDFAQLSPLVLPELGDLSSGKPYRTKQQGKATLQSNREKADQKPKAEGQRAFSNSVTLQIHCSFRPHA
jgi:hypothetical protein